MSIRNRAALLLHRLADRSRAAALRLAPITFDGSGLLYIPNELPIHHPPSGEAKAR